MLKRLCINDTLPVMINKLSENNHEVKVVISAIVNSCRYEVRNVGYILTIDHLELYGDKFYRFWHYCCNDSVTTCLKVLRMVVDQKISEGEFYAHINGNNCIPFNI